MSPAFSQKADSIGISTILDKNAQLNMKYPFEKVYVHFDKPYYAVGDTLWFKAYVTSIQNIPSPLSKVIYLDVITDRDSLVETIKLPISNSVAAGSISLSDENYKQGNYHIRAYTRWMLNFDPSYFFNRNLYVGNAINKDLNSHIDLSAQRDDKNIRVNAKILFKNEDNRPLRNRRVNWEVNADFDRVSRGRGATDSEGYLNIEFSSGRNVPIQEGSLTTRIEVDNREFLETHFPLNRVNVDNDIQFFPEGGDLIDELPTQVAFKAIRSDGLGIGLTGEVVDESGTVVAALTSEHLGMGKFTLVPQLGKQYSANIQFADGSQGSFKLPDVKAEGMTLSVDNSDSSQLKFRIYASSAYLDKHFGEGFYIIGRSAGVVYYAAQSVLKSQVHSGSVPKSNFPSGVAQLSILSASGKVLSERVAFILNDDTLQMNLKAELPTYSARQKVSMKLRAADGGEPVLGNFSVAVIDESKVPVQDESETSIISSLLLSSEIEGYIEKPNYYFINTDAVKLAKLDLLMLTQGYRRYLYEDIVSGKSPSISFLPEQDLSISGIVRRSDGMPLINNPILLQIPEKAFYKDGITDDKGRFVFSELIFQDSVEAVINARGVSSDRNLMINVDGEPYPSLAGNVNAPDELQNIDSDLEVYLKNSQLQNSTGFLLKEVQIQGQVRKPSHTDHAALSGLNMLADYITESDQLPGCTFLINCLSSITGLTYDGNYVYITRNYNSGNRRPAEIYVGGMPVDINYLHNLQSSGIESIEVFTDDGLSGINQRSNTSGVIVINLKEVKKQQISKSELQDLFPPSNILKFNPKGYSANRVFYVPRYSGPRTSLQAQDRRSTIHWDPLLLTNEDGEASFEYFTADDKGTYRVVIEGIDSEGHIGRAVYRFNVE